jgi:hypothetical protein
MDNTVLVAGYNRDRIPGGGVMANSRSYQNDIERMGKDAHDLLEALYAEPFPDDDVVYALRDRIEQSAKTVIEAAAHPVTLGVVEEFSVGKSLLLSS